MKCDVLVVGSGILGTASAYYIKKNNPHKDVLLVDSLGYAGQGNTGRSNGMFRNTFTSIDNQILSNSSIDFYINVQRSGYNIGLQKIGYLWLVDEEKTSSFERSTKKMKENGVEIVDYEVRELGRILSFEPSPSSDESVIINARPISKGFFGPKCGRLAPEKLAEFYLSMFKSIGGKVMFGVKVERLILSALDSIGIDGEPFVWQKWKFSQAKTKSDVIEFESVVVAAGAWLNSLLEPLGFDYQVRSKKRQIFALSASENKGLFSLMYTKGFNELGILPLVILPVAGVHFKPVPESEDFWVACEDDVNREFIDIPAEDISYYKAEPEYFGKNIHPVLKEYFPQFSKPIIKNMWAGLYAYHLPDCLPFVQKEENMIVVGGDSGSGIMKADSLARIVDSAYRNEQYAELYDGIKYPVERISVKNRKVEPETLVI